MQTSNQRALAIATSLAACFLITVFVIDSVATSPSGRPQRNVSARNPVNAVSPFAVSPTHPDVLQTQDLGGDLTLEDIIAALVGTSSIAISNVRFTGSDSALGVFTGGTEIIGFEQGIVLSSGRVASVVGPNQDDAMTWNHGRPGDLDLDSLIPAFQTEDACILEFDFECPNVRAIGFEYVFSSEEYNEFVNNNYNDVFGFFVNGKNIALLPDGQTVVSINNVNGGNPLGDSASNPQYYRNNDECQFSTVPSCPFNTEMDGLTVVLIAKAKINPGVNHIKLAVADVGDGAFDSNVFLKGQSFVCGAVNNTAPICVINPPGPFSVNTGTSVNFTVTGTDADTGQLIYLYTFGNLPPGATMNPPLPRAGSRTGLSSQFSWVPTQIGTYFASFFLTDSLGGSDTATAEINVSAAQTNNPPVCVITPPGPFTINAGTNLTFTVTGTDPDSGQTIYLSTFGTLPPGATMTPALPISGPQTGVTSQFSWTPSQPGIFFTRYLLSDSLSGLDTASAQIRVLEGTPPRVIGTIPVDGATEVPWSRTSNVDFTEHIAFSSLNEESITASSERHGSLVPTSLWSINTNRVVIAPSLDVGNWPDDDTITIQISGAITDSAGNGLDGNSNGTSEGSPADDYIFSFTTAPGVYPGDANDDGIVDERDVLPLGVHFLRTGPGRNRNFDIWALESAAPWSPREATHADCDGNGIIDSNDVCTILEFFDRVVPAKRSVAEFHQNALSVLDQDVRAALARALVDCNRGSASARAALLEALADQSEVDAPAPASFRLAQNYPNPFNAGTIIQWGLEASGQVDLVIFDILGRRVRKLVDAELPAGFHTINWDGADDEGAAMASGVYIYRLNMGTQTAVRRMVLIR
jgi:hypothetical protein